MLQPSLNLLNMSNLVSLHICTWSGTSGNAGFTAVQIRCANSFSSVCGAQERIVRNSLLWLPSFQTSPEI